MYPTRWKRMQQDTGWPLGLGGSMLLAIMVTIFLGIIGDWVLRVSGLQ